MQITSRLGNGAKWGDDSDEPTGKLGDECYRNDFCESNMCSSGTISRGVCVECLTHDDCDGHGESLPGTLPEAFCHENACSRWKRGRPISEDGYPIWLGHEVGRPSTLIDACTMHLLHFSRQSTTNNTSTDK